MRVDPKVPPAGSKPLYVTVIGHQWWWEYVYERYDDQRTELHHRQRAARARRAMPGVSRPVYLTLKSADVCHSFWVPRLAGKTDLIPGRTNQMWFQTNQQGVFLGQCAEYCGTQHANMLLRVNVDSPAGVPGLAREPAKTGRGQRTGTRRPRCFLVSVVRQLPPRNRHQCPRELMAPT